MSILHTVNSSGSLTSCHECIDSGDIILLIQDGVYAALDGHLTERWLTKEVTVCVLTDDVVARGLQDRIPVNIQTVSFDGFVKLSCTTDKTVSWF